MRAGFDIFFAKPGTVSEKYCEVCGTLCAVRRDVVGPTSFASAMAQRHTLHDQFACPHGGQAWHERALRLAQAIEESPSPRVAAMMRQDLEDLLREHGLR